MFGKHGTVLQIGLAAIGLVIVVVVLIGPRGHQTTSLIATPAADLGANGTPAAHAVVQQAGDQSSGGQAAAPSDGSAPAGSGSAAQQAAPASASAGATTSSSGSASAALPSVPAVPAVGGLGRTLFLDNFTSDPLGALPTGWLLADPTSSSSGLGGLPILGTLLGGLTQSGGGPVPSIVDDGAHVLSRPAGSWSHIAAGPMTVDSAATADVRMLGQSSGFAGVTGRFQDVNDSLMCGLNGGNVLQLWQTVGGHQQLLASTPVAAAMNVFHTVTMAMQGGQVSCSLDGGSTLHATGSWTSPGRVGLVALGNVTSEFDRVAATALP